MGAAVPANLQEGVVQRGSDRRDAASYVSTETSGMLSQTEQPELQGSAEIGTLQSAVLQALTDNSQRILASMLEGGEWSVQGNELVIKVSESQTVVDMSLGAEAKRLMIASASGVLGRALKLRVIAGATVAAENKRNGDVQRSPGPGGRSRAEQDPVVRRMQEKFGAQIRTVIDYKENR
jgi:hypothetical protein